MFINDIPKAACDRLVLINLDVRLIDAAKLLAGGTDIVVVHDREGVVKGVVTKTDVVKQMSVCKCTACDCRVATVMTCNPVLCHGSDALQDVSQKMQARHLKNIVMVDEGNRPVGLLSARSILRGLLVEAQHNEEQLADYVSGFGYR